MSPNNKREMYRSTSEDNAPGFGNDQQSNGADVDLKNTDRKVPDEDYLERNESVENLPAEDMNEMQKQMVIFYWKQNEM